jgi:threonine dehydrogenase-like Zn-dependent dehydrogenase
MACDRAAPPQGPAADREKITVERSKMQSRAVVMTGVRSLEIRELQVPTEAPPGGAIMRVLVNGLCGSDYDLYVGHIDQRYRPYPMIPGHEMVGEIVLIDPAAELTWGVSSGDRVAVEPIMYCGQCEECVAGRARFCTNASSYSATSVTVEPGLWGGMSEFMVLRAGTRLHKIPTELSDEDAGLFNPFANAFEWTARTGQVQIGDRVLITGCGQRGLACATVARESGAAQVIVTGLSRDAYKLTLAAEFGATDALNVEQVDTVEAVMTATEGHGVDKVIDTAPGATDTIVHGVQVLRNEGTLVLAGEKGRDITGFRTDWIHRKALTIRGAFATTPWSTAQAIRILTDGSYPFAKLHSHTLGLKDVERGIRMLGGEIDGGDVLHISVRPSSG